MYDFIEGNVVERNPAQAVLQAGPVGYRFTVPLSTSDALPARGPARLYAHTFVRDERIELYGFATPLERRVFLLLTSVGGIGPQMALKVLSGMAPPALIDAVARGRIEVLVRVKGIGRKLAERIVLELRDAAAALACSAGEAPGPGDDRVAEDAVTALTKLGFSNAEARRSVEKARKDMKGESTCEALIRRALG